MWLTQGDPSSLQVAGPKLKGKKTRKLRGEVSHGYGRIGTLTRAPSNDTASTAVARPPFARRPATFFPPPLLPRLDSLTPGDSISSQASTGSTRAVAVTLVASTTTGSCGTSITRVTSVRSVCATSTRPSKSSSPR